MSILITLLTTVLVLNCFFLVLLILIQLPKKESGSGLAFGGGALDMALGAGAGNILTRLTKYSASLFLLLCLVLAVIGNNSSNSVLKEGLTAPPVAKTTATDTPIMPGTTPPAPGSATTETPVTPEKTENPVGTEAPSSSEATTPTPDAATTKIPETPAQPAEGEEKK